MKEVKEEIERLHKEFDKRQYKLSSVFTEAMLLMELKIAELETLRNEQLKSTAHSLQIRKNNLGNNMASIDKSSEHEGNSITTPTKRKRDVSSKEKRLSDSHSPIKGKSRNSIHNDDINSNDKDNKALLTVKITELVNAMDEKRRSRVMAALNACFNYMKQTSQNEVIEFNDKERNNFASPNTIAQNVNPKATTTFSAEQKSAKKSLQESENVELVNINGNQSSMDGVSMTESSGRRSSGTIKEFCRPREVPREVWNDMLELRQQRLQLENSLMHILYTLQLQIHHYELLQKDLHVIEYGHMATIHGTQPSSA